MDKVEKEIRDLLRNNLNTNHSAEVGTTLTNIKVTNHGLSNGDWIMNVTRGNVVSIVVVIDANNFTVDPIVSQTNGDTIQFLRFKKYYVGEIDAVPINYLPIIAIYGKQSKMLNLTTNRDKWEFDVFIEVYTNAFAKVAEVDVNDDVMLAQQQLRQLMEGRDVNGVALTTSILGILRRHIIGTSYLYSNNITIRYDKHSTQNKVYFKATMELSAVSRFSLRS